MRALLAAVVAMGVLIVMGTTVLVVTIVSRLHSGSFLATKGPVTLYEPAGTKITSATSDGKTLTLVLSGPHGEEIEVRDLASGEVERSFVVSK